ncbi:MAG: glycosyltransferase family 2 protein [Candidatus Omnitrophica bacterium]|nr:glycosyltransferase family 2 protein [Candidatus Omnitrophota bacterium]
MTRNNNTNIMLSVIMTAYNEEKYISQAVESVLNQAYRDFELIIINDGSTDNTLEALNKYNDPRTRIINNEKNAGPAAARNLGIKTAVGKYCAIFDADDISLPERFSAQITFMEQNPGIAVVGTDYCEIDEKGVFKRKIKKFTNDSQIKRHLSLQTGDTCLAHTTSMFRKKAVEAIGFYDEEMIVCEDKDLWIRLADEGYNFANIAGVLVNKRAAAVNAANFEEKSKKHKRIKRYLYSKNKDRFCRLRKKYINIKIPGLPKHGGEPEDRRSYAELYFKLGRALYKYSKTRLARKALFIPLGYIYFDGTHIAYRGYSLWLATFGALKVIFPSAYRFLQSQQFRKKLLENIKPLHKNAPVPPRVIFFYLAKTLFFARKPGYLS